MTDLRIIPSIEQLRQRERAQALERSFGRDAVTDALRAAAADVRSKLGGSDANTIPLDVIGLIEQAAEAKLQESFRPSLGAVINATGVIIHTNLGRAPLSASAARAVSDLSVGYTNLEYDLARGERGSRDHHAEALLCRLTGAESGIIVNNNAAATLLVLAAVAAGREVVISRGELVEIGGGFRIPDVMTQSGAMLREVGTTNKTRIADYGAAVNDRTALILRVHPSNFRIEGFTERPTLDELVQLGRRLKIPVAEDLGSGNLLDRSGSTEGRDAVIHEPTVQASVAAGMDLVFFSGDKMLGGPQCGVIVGRAALVGNLRRHPLMRALRAGRMTYAALEATLIEYQRGHAEVGVPVVRMIAIKAEEIERRAKALASLPPSMLSTALVPGTSTIGGGSAPGMTLPTVLVTLERRGWTPDELESHLRRLDPPVIARIEDERVVLDLRTVLPEQDELLARLLSGIGKA